MVKNVVKSMSEKMICGQRFGVVEAPENRSAGREETQENGEETHQPTHVVNSTERDDNYVVRTIR